MGIFRGAHNLERPKFLSSYIKAVGQSADKRGWRAVIPWGLLVSAGVGVACAYVVPISFWDDSRLDVSTAVYLGVLMLDGLILALSWGAFSRIYESISTTKFASYLMEKELLNGYIVYNDAIHIAQILAIVSSAAALVVLLIDLPKVIFDQIAFGIMICLSANAIKAATSAVTVMHNLIWQKAIFDQHMEDRESERVVKIRKE